MLLGSLYSDDPSPGINTQYARPLGGTLLTLALVSYVQGYAYLQHQIPNGEFVPHPCKPNFLWKGVGHENLNGDGTNNAFGLDFKANNFVWDSVICMKDSDGDGRTNGEELGDPDCTWVPGTAPKFTSGLSHPGVCEPMDSSVCEGKTGFVDCDAGEFMCPAVDEPETFSHTVRFPHTDVPAKETTYMCMLFDFPTNGNFHMVATAPEINNTYIMHHILVYGCNPEQNVTNPLNKPYDCNMQADDACTEIIGMWTVGISGQCYHSETGFSIGASGYRIGAIEMHWNNPEIRKDYTDSSGMTFFLTPNLRTYEAGVLMLGQRYLEIPPHQTSYSTEGRCKGSCTTSIMEGPVYITDSFNHMHYLGIAQKTELISGNITTDLAWDRFYSYDSPKIYNFQDPIVMRPGDEVVTTCTYRSTSRTVTTYYGESTSAEMCFAFLVYYPKENMKRTYCTQTMNIGTCDWYGGTVDGCDLGKIFNMKHPETQAMYSAVWNNCIPGKCQLECLKVVRELKRHPCLSGDFAKWNRYRAYQNYQRSNDEQELIWNAMFDSCDQELAEEQCRHCPEDTVGRAEVRRMNIAVILGLILIAMTSLF